MKLGVLNISTYGEIMLKLLLSLCLGLTTMANANVFSSKEEATEHRNSVSDQELEGKIRDKISSGTFSKGYDQVNVKVKEGVVTLDGTVPTQDDKDKVEKEVRQMSGVKGLNSNLSVNDKEAR